MTALPTSPTSLLNRSIRRMVWVVLPVIALAVVSALRPIERASIDVEVPGATGGKTQPKIARATIDAEAFAAPLWVPPPVVAKVPPPVPLPPPAPLKLQLIGIMKETPTDGAPGSPAILRAALYDLETDTLHIVAAGERVGTGRFTVSKLTVDAVELADGRERRTLSLRSETRPTSP